MPGDTADRAGQQVNYEIPYADGRRDKLHLVDQPNAVSTH
jgi:hypothetical protein